MTLSHFDHYLKDDGPAALVLREPLMPVEGKDGVVFPATFAEIGYNIDEFPNGTNVCVIDTVGSQANRIEPMFLEEPFNKLVPQIIVKAGSKEINILEACHRAGDAIIRCSSLKTTIDEAFLASIKGDAEPLAKIAPTSLVFGVWNSRGEQGAQDKRPRLIASTIRAFNVRKLQRSANYLVQQQIDYVRDGVVPEWEDLPKADKDKLSEKGFQNALANHTHGGVIADGGVRRDATLGLAALRLLHAGNPDSTLKLRRYILGLALVAFTANRNCYLRQGCMLVLDPAQPREFVEIYATGERKPCTITDSQALDYAKLAADAFGIGKDQTVDFEKERAKREISGDAAEGDSAKGAISSIDTETRKFTLGRGNKMVQILTCDNTAYFIRDESSRFEDVVKSKAKVEVELANGVAVKITAK